jgi:fucose 4-O-acetylase-like acetyltransferase
MFTMTISCIIHVKTRFLDRATYQESIAEKTNSLARSVAELYAFEVLLAFMSISPVLCHIFTLSLTCNNVSSTTLSFSVSL